VVGVVLGALSTNFAPGEYSNLPSKPQERKNTKKRKKAQNRKMPTAVAFDPNEAAQKLRRERRLAREGRALSRARIVVGRA
jgi:hypothetical protein